MPYGITTSFKLKCNYRDYVAIKLSIFSIFVIAIVFVNIFLVLDEYTFNTQKITNKLSVIF